MPDLTDYLRASNGSGEAVRCIVVEPRGVGDLVFNNTTPTNWHTYFIAMAGTVDPVTDRFIEGEYIVFKGHLDGSAITIDELAPGYVDNGNLEDDIIVIKPTTLWADIVADAVDGAVATADAALAGVAAKLDAVVAGSGIGVNNTTPTIPIVSMDITGLTGKTTPADADQIPIADSAASNAPKKLTWANLKATLLTWLKGLTTLVGWGIFLDEDTMSSNSDTKVPSQQSVKAYVDTGLVLLGKHISLTDGVGQAITAGSYVKKTWDTASGDYSGVLGFSNANDRVTIDSARVKAITVSAGLQFGSSNVVKVLRVYKNGLTERTLNFEYSMDGIYGGGVTIPVVQNDYIEIYIFCGANSSVISANNYFQVTVSGVTP